ncbi:uncharacterized protein C8orf48 homolog isoform X3 [Pantherophis guttatus]|uniref:Uncharacterized protein C8orf48 homolog isoform X3 n=1 Tax=Pantherophis guttatus TaxID=94885 RepID=A0A6P9D5M4_PANGU|nr:uncharacterized protein C8orf48 homolog isoform X3 [Pantherophis guttatus]
MSWGHLLRSRWGQTETAACLFPTTFTSVTEEKEEKRQYEDDSFESYDSADELKEPAASDLTEDWQSSCQKDEALPGISEEELGTLQSFCVSKINHLHHQRILEPLRRNSCKEQRPRMVSRRQQTGGCGSAVPFELVNRLHLKSLKEMMKKIAETEIHQPSQCPFCMKKREGFAKVEFLRRKKTILDNVLLQEKLEDYMYTKDSLTLIGEIHKSLPKLSEDPSNIWQELNKRGWQE